MRRTYRQQRRWRLSPHTLKRIYLSVGIVAGIFVVTNIVLWAMYQNRTYPQTQVMGTGIGGVAYGDLSDKVSELDLLPASIKFSHDKQLTAVKLADLGITKDVSRTVGSAKEQRSWLPILNLFKAPELQAPIKMSSKDLDKSSEALAKVFHVEATDARLLLTGSTVTIEEAKNGYTMNKSALESTIVKALDKGQIEVTVPAKTLTPKITASELEDDKQVLEKQLTSVVTFKYSTKSRQVSRDEIAKWYVQSGNVYALSTDNVRNYITQVGSSFGIRVKDLNQAATATTQAVTAGRAATVTLAAQIAVKSYSYCVAAKGISTSHLSAVRTKLQSTFADSRGWSINGLVEFKEVGSGCDFTVWLAEASLMPSFGAICDSMWSCRVGPNVVLNFDRWQNASPSWNANGGTLEEYRYMVINHETGHWLGFGHDHCGGSGQAAPVMQQQSIDLQGCKFSPWPNAKEINVLRTRLGI